MTFYSYCTVYAMYGNSAIEVPFFLRFMFSLVAFMRAGDILNAKCKEMHFLFDSFVSGPRHRVNE